MFVKHDNGNVHQAAAKILQAEKAARPAAPRATYCYRAYSESEIRSSTLIRSDRITEVNE